MGEEDDIMLCDMQTQLTSIPLNSKGQGQLVTFVKGHLVRIFWSLPFETTRTDCIANHHFGTVSLCLQKISKFISKTNITL